MTGNSNTYLGWEADGTADISNATAIGANTQVTQSNSVVLGSIAGVNGAVADTSVGIGTNAPQARLHVVGNVKLVDPFNRGLSAEVPADPAAMRFVLLR